MGKTILVILGIVVVVLIVAFGTGFLDINQTREAVLPRVTVEGGQLPAAEVNTGEISLGTETTDVTVPDVNVDVGTQTKQIETPTLNIEPAPKN